MHVADSVLSPTVCAAAGAVSVAALGYSVHRLRDQLADRTIPLTGMMSALIFAGQMVNFPLIGVPISGHLMGGVLASAILGPWAGLVSLSLVLIVQCLLFADGGLLALGVNILHMGVIGAWGGYAVLQLVASLFKTRRTGILVGSVVASWLSVVAASTLFSGEFWYSYRGTPNFDFQNIFTLMVLVHSAIGIGEALITAGVLAQVMALRPDLVATLTPVPAAERLPLGRFLTGGIVAALAIAAFLAPFASEFPDGLEAVAGREKFESLAQPTKVALLDEYAVPAPVKSWQRTSWWEPVSVALAGILGTLGIAAISFAFARSGHGPADNAGASA